MRSQARLGATRLGSPHSSPDRSPRCCGSVDTQRWLLAAVLPLAYVQWQAPVRDVNRSANDPSVPAAYYEPLLAFLRHQTGPPFRIEIPFTKFHWETYDGGAVLPPGARLGAPARHQVQPALLRRHADAQTYEAWLRSLAVRFVAISDAPLDYSAERRRR